MEQIAENLSSDPLADPVMKLIHGARKFKLLENALEMGIFDDLETAHQPVTAERLANKHAFSVDKLTRFLDALCAIQLVGKSTNKKGKSLYFNLSGTSKYLTRSHKPGLLAMVMMESKMVLPMLDKLPVLMEHGNNMDIMSKYDGVKASEIIPQSERDETTPPRTNNDLTNNNHLTGGALESQIKFLMCMESFSSTCVQALVRAFDLSGHKKAVDLGGGSGAVGIEVAKVYRSMNVTILDLPHVVQVAKKIKPILPENVSFYPGNFFQDAIPIADLYILGHIIHDWDDKHISVLLTRVFDTLLPGGSVLILEKILNPEKDGPELPATQNLLMSLITQGRERNEQEYRMLLSSHGFEEIATRKIPGYNAYDAIMCKKPALTL